MTMKRLVLLGCLLAVLFAPASAPAQAQMAWEPGTYTGWVYVTARLSKNHSINQQGVNLRQDTVIYWQAHGDLTVRAEAGDQGWVSVYLPFEITGQENGFVTMPNGSCTFNMLGLGQSVVQDLAALTAGPIGSEFRVPLVVPGTTASVAHNSATGQCGNMAQSALFIQDTIKNTTSKISGLRFKVGYTSPLSVGGTCELTEWEMSTAIQFGSLSRENVECFWRVFREP